MGAILLLGSFAAALFFAFWVFSGSGYSKWFALFAALAIGPVLWGCAVGLYFAATDPCTREWTAKCSD
jgi:hypothetical protein